MTRFDPFDRRRPLIPLALPPSQLVIPALIRVLPARDGGLIRAYARGANPGGLAVDLLDGRGRVVVTRVITNTPEGVFGSGLGGDGAGGYVVVYGLWAQDRSSLRMRFLDASAHFRGEEVTVVSDTELEPGQYIGSSMVTQRGPGRFALAWVTCGYPATGGNSCTLYSRPYRSDGVPLAAASTVASRVAPRLTDPLGLFPADLAFDRLGNLVVLWQVEREGGAPDWADLVARQYDPSGNPVGSPFFVNDPRRGDQVCGQVGVDDRGRWTFSWLGDGPQGYEIYARQFQDPEQEPR